MELPAPLDVLGGIPDPEPLVTHPRVEPLGEVLVPGAVAEEARVELDRAHRADQGREIGDQGVRYAAPAEERFGDLAPRAEERIRAERTRACVFDGIEAIDLREINIGKYGTRTSSPGEVGPAEVGPAEAGPAEVGPTEVGPAEVGPAEVGLAEVGRGEVGLAEVGPAEVGPAEVGPAEVGLAEVGPAEVRNLLAPPPDAPDANSIP